MIEIINWDKTKEIVKDNLIGNDYGMMLLILNEFSSFEDIIVDIKEKLSPNMVVYLNIIDKLEINDIIFSDIYPYIRNSMITKSLMISSASYPLNQLISIMKDTKREAIYGLAPDLFSYSNSIDSYDWNTNVGVLKELSGRGKLEI